MKIKRPVRDKAPAPELAEVLGIKRADCLTQPEVSVKYGIPESTLRYWRYVNEGPRSFRLGRRVLYAQTDLDIGFASQFAATAKGGGRDAA